MIFVVKLPIQGGNFTDFEVFETFFSQNASKTQKIEDLISFISTVFAEVLVLVPKQSYCTKLDCKTDFEKIESQSILDFLK